MSGALWSEVILPAFATLFVVIDPIGLVPLFMALTAGQDGASRRKTALFAVALGLGILLIFAVFGNQVLGFLGISLPAFRIAGGLLLFVLALEMLFEKRTERRERNVREAAAEHAAEPTHSHDDSWVFPLGTPLIAGPGAITSVILLMSAHAGSLHKQAAIIGVLAAVIGMALLLFLLAGSLSRFISPTATKAMTRVLGMVLAALAVQFVLTGLKQAGFGG